MFLALLDTSVLWPSLQRDFLLSLAIEGLYRPLWSEAVLEELQEQERRKLIRRGVAADDASTRALRLVTVMRREFGDALVSGWEPLEGSFGLPDPDDEHVVAAAVMGGAGAIVTANTKDFPRTRIPSSIAIDTVQDFCANAASVDPERAALALGEIAVRRLNPRQSPQELLQILVSRYGMDEAAAIVAPHLASAP